MQTFLPYANAAQSARVLDTARLGKQRVECLQILATLTDIYKMPDASPKHLDINYGEFSTTPAVFCTHAGDIWGWNPHRAGGWRNHPAVKMWEFYEAALVEYSLAICAEWIYRGYKDSTAQTISLMADLSQQLVRNQRTERGVDPEFFFVPVWWDKDEFHLSHQSNLLRKDKEHYGKFFPEVESDLPYYWPASLSAYARSTRQNRGFHSRG